MALLVTKPLQAASSKIDTKTLKKKVFAGSPELPCKVISRGLNLDLANLDPKLDEFIKELISDLKEQDQTDLLSRFHPRLKMPANQVAALFSEVRVNFGRKSDFSLYRVWALNQMNGEYKPRPCVGDKISVQAHYGFDIYFGLWIQVMGNHELGRIYTTVVPTNTGWRLGSFHLHQWTHQGADPDSWVQKALADHEAGFDFPAYVKLDVAEKLLNGGGFMFFQLREDIKATKLAYYPGNQFMEFLNKRLKPQRVVDSSSFLARDGAGFLIRIEVKQDTKSAKLKAICEDASRKLFNTELLKRVGGFKCGFVVPGENPRKEGYLGSRFIPNKKIAAILKKAK